MLYPSLACLTVRSCKIQNPLFRWSLMLTDAERHEAGVKETGGGDLYCYGLAKYVWGKQEWSFWIISCIYYTARGREECLRQACCTISCSSACSVCVCWRVCSCRRAQCDQSHFSPPWNLSFLKASFDLSTWAEINQFVTTMCVWSSTLRKDNFGKRCLFRWQNQYLGVWFNPWGTEFCSFFLH